jgi:AcrR family transcriptional regulator
MDRTVQRGYPAGMDSPASTLTARGALTPRGAATRDRIVSAAADLVLERGAQATSLDDIRARTQTSKSQLFHYFPGGKGELVSAIARLQSERVLDAQRPWLDGLDTWESWDGWRRAVLSHYGSQTHLSCPIGALTAELIRSEPARGAELAAHMDRWRAYLQRGLERMSAAGRLDHGADPAALALGVFAALHGGLALMAMMNSLDPLRAALDGALASLRAAGRPALV